MDQEEQDDDFLTPPPPPRQHRGKRTKGAESSAGGLYMTVQVLRDQMDKIFCTDRSVWKQMLICDSNACKHVTCTVSFKSKSKGYCKYSSTNYSVDDTSDPPKIIVIGAAARSPERSGACLKARKGSSQKALVPDPLSQPSQQGTFVVPRVQDKCILEEDKPPPTEPKARRKWLNRMRQRCLRANRAQQE